MKNLREEVASKLATSSQAVQDRVVANLVEEEVTRRTKLVTLALQAYEEAEKKLKAVRPDQQSFDVSGNLVAETYSKGKLDEKVKTEQLLKNLSAALDKALENNDWQPLEKLTKQG